MITWRIEFNNIENQRVQADIIDTKSDSNNTTIHLLPGSGTPVRLQSIDNSEDKFTPIRAKQCIVEFLSSEQWNLNTFAEGEDNRFKMDVYVAGAMVFTGFLVLPELQEDYLCPPNIVSLTATDGLGLLKDIPYTDYLGAHAKGRFKIIIYLTDCLLKTGLVLPINLEWNLRETRKTDSPFWDNIYLDAKTWEDEIGVSIDCYTILERILGEHCFVTQHKGEWWIQRVDEMFNEMRTTYKVTYDLTGISFINTTYNKTILKTGSLFWIDRSAYVGLERPHKSLKITYPFELPKEIPDNVDFVRGAQIFVVATGPDESVYNLDDWTKKRNFPALGTPTIGAYIRRKINPDGVELERYVYIPASNTGGNTDYIESKPIPVSIKDKFNVSFDFSYDANVSNAVITDIKSVIYVKAGNTVFSLDKEGVWSSGYKTITAQWDSTKVDERDWQTLSIDAKPLPIAGDVYICLIKSSVFTNRETRYQNLQFNYQPYINSTYRTFKGQYWQIKQTGEYKAKREQDVFISDSPKKLFKGAMTYFTAGLHNLTGRWADWTDPAYVITGKYDHFGEIQIEANWKQYRRVMRLLDGSLKGLSNDDLPDLIHTYTLADSSPHTDNRKFMCLHFDQDLKSCKWSGYFIEIDKTGDTNIYTETKEFKYSEDR